MLFVGIGVENGGTNGALVAPTFQEASTILHHCVIDGGVRTPVDGMASQKVQSSKGPYLILPNRGMTPVAQVGFT